MVEEHYVPGILACYLVLIVEESEGTHVGSYVQEEVSNRLEVALPITTVYVQDSLGPFFFSDSDNQNLMLLLRLLWYVSCPGIPGPLQHFFAALECYVYLKVK